MAKYESKYKELMFYVDNSPRKFIAGKFETDDKAEQEALAKLADVKRVDEPAPAPKAKPEVAPKAKAKSSGK
jgi:hypothetical protein